MSRPKPSPWWLFPEPVRVSWTQFVIYALIAALGIYGYMDPPVSIQESFLPFAAVWWSSLFVLAGVVGFVSIPRGLQFVEEIALWSLWTGIGVYVVVLIEAGARYTDKSGYDFLVVAFLIIGGYSVARWFRIHGTAIDPRKIRDRPISLEG